MMGFADLFFRSSKTPKEASAGYAFRNTLLLCEARLWLKLLKHSELKNSFGTK